MTDDLTFEIDPRRVNELAKATIERGYALRRRRRLALVSPIATVAAVVSLWTAFRSSGTSPTIRVTTPAGSIPSTTRGPAASSTTIPAPRDAPATSAPSRISVPAVASQPPAAPVAPVARRHGRLLYTSLAIMSIGADGSDQRALVAASAGGLVIDRSARYLAFSRAVDSSTIAVEVAGTDGSDRRTIMSSGQSYSPTWSSTGQLAFVHSDPTTSDVYVADMTAGTTRRVTTNGTVLAVRWAPTGNLLAYTDTSGITVIDSDGNNGVRLATALDTSDFAWSPDGHHIGFVTTNAPPSTRGAWVVAPDGSGLRRLPLDCSAGATWSPDSSWFACQGPGGVVATDVRTDAVRQITDGPKDASPAWSPDGKTIAFLRDYDLMVVDQGGEGPADLLGTTGGSMAPSVVWWPL